MSRPIATSLDEAVNELMRVAKLPGELRPSDLDNLRHDLGYDQLGAEYFYARLVEVVNGLPGRDCPHAKLLLRLDHFDENLTRRRDVAHERHKVTKEGAARVRIERYVLAQVVYGVTQRMQRATHGGQGYEFEAVRFRYWFEDDPDQLRVDSEFDLRFTRNDVRVFTYGSDFSDGIFYDIACLSEELGHRFLRQVPMRATAPKAENYAFFYLGGDTVIGAQATIAVREFWSNEGQGKLREHGVYPVSGGGPLTITLDAPRSLVSHYANFAEPHVRGRRPPQQMLIERTNDEPVELAIAEPNPNYIYGFWYMAP